MVKQTCFAGAALILALIASSVLAAEPKGKPKSAVPSAWRYSESTDSMTGGKIRVATVLSRNAVTFSFPYGGPQRATLHLREHPRYGQDVILSLGRAQFMCPAVSDCEVVIRMGDGPPRSFSVGTPTDNSSDTLFIRKYSSFVDEMQRVNLIRIEALFFRDGARVFEFPVAGLSAKWRIPEPEQSFSSDNYLEEKRRERTTLCQAAAEQEPAAERRAFVRRCEREEKSLQWPD